MTPETPKPSPAAPAANWTELPHWVVMVRERFDTERCIAHWPTRAEAAAHARRARLNYGHGTRVWTQRVA